MADKLDKSTFEIFSKLDYLELFYIAGEEGLTANEVAKELPDLYAQQRKTVETNLRRFYHQQLLKRVKEGREYRYFLTKQGLDRYSYFTELKEV